ncbi:OmpA family protein [Enterobacteriaceae bacterium H11S18]|uniref:OmpA family protein n=1 Tax=Dryocola clanedunensis TaxID=2925396 RepID=UPI0022F055A3|nr:OmpA family protein [Dryocola clanedunensis]MCT4708948.1 OmpA family protein [Dryocola clanedunensis]
MKNNIIESLDAGISPEMTALISEVICENELGVKKTLAAIFPLLMHKTIDCLNTVSLHDHFVKMLEQLPFYESMPHLSWEAASNDSSVLSAMIEQLNALLFPESTARLERKISRYVGFPAETVRKIMTIGSAFFFNAIKEYLLKSDEQSLPLKEWLISHRKHSDALVPAGLVNLLSKEELAEYYPLISREPEKKKCKKKWPWWLLWVLLIALLIFVLRGCYFQQKTTETTSSWGNLGAFISKQLPNGNTLKFPESGMENKLIGVIESQGSTSVWLSFDRLKFKTNSADLQPESEEQMKNIAEIMKAYPDTRLELGGYTDNTGDKDFNMELSKKRADSVRQGLINLGANGDNLEAHGFGSEFPVAPNNTEDNRAKNRRIDIRILK